MRCATLSADLASDGTRLPIDENIPRSFQVTSPIHPPPSYPPFARCHVRGCSADVLVSRYQGRGHVLNINTVFHILLAFRERGCWEEAIVRGDLSTPPPEPLHYATQSPRLTYSACVRSDACRGS